MRLPLNLLTSKCLVLQGSDELIAALAGECLEDEAQEIKRLYDIGLPPITSRNALSVMLGYSPGFVWSLLNRTPRYYRTFEIPKGKDTRKIMAPQVGLKIIQKWLSHHLQDKWPPNEYAYGFITGRSHIEAAKKHLESEWVFSIDIENFFPSVSSDKVIEALRTLGYQTRESLKLISTICCYRGNLAQGAPSSPIISNIVLDNLDRKIAELVTPTDLTYTRYADDIVLSGKGTPPEGLLEKVEKLVVDDGWVISERKKHLSQLPKRLKVHGLLVHGKKIRLTKGYRNRIRAFNHLLSADKIKSEHINIIKGHLNYAKQISDGN